MPNASIWSNSKKNSPRINFGLSIHKHYQTVVFNSTFSQIDLYHNGILIAQNINVSGKKCKELLHANIKQWIIQNGWHQHPTEHPHQLTLRQNGNTNRFDVL